MMLAYGNILSIGSPNLWGFSQCERLHTGAFGEGVSS